MIAIAVATAVFILLAVLILRAATQDVRASRTPRWLPVAAWPIYLLHADTVVAAAYLDVAKVPVPATPFLAVGLATAAIGWAFFLAATVTLVRHGQFEGLQPTRLVTRGPFRLSRHPQNTGWAVLLIGVAFASRSVPALLLVALFGVFAARLARLEEQDLERRRGPEYGAYRARTPLVLGPTADVPRRSRTAPAEAPIPDGTETG